MLKSSLLNFKVNIIYSSQNKYSINEYMISDYIVLIVVQLECRLEFW